MDSMRVAWGDAIATALIAHQGGWDEIALVGGPIIVIVVVLAIAKRRVDSQFDGTAVSDETEPGSTNAS